MSAWNGKHGALARRELWEHRGLWAAPTLMGIVLVFLPLFGNFQFGPRRGPEVVLTPELSGQAAMVLATAVMGGVLCIAVFAYLLDCLYAERKDRSILFWKSLPVSDVETVLTKIGVAVLLMPLLVLLLALVVQPLLLGTAGLRGAPVSFGSVISGYELLPRIGMTWLYGVLWYSPVVAYLMLASVLARRVPLMYALMPPGVLMLLEGLVLRSGHVAEFIGGRLIPWARRDFAWAVGPNAGQLGFGSPDWARLYANSELWLGLAAAAGMVYIVVVLRRYRDDT